MKSKKLWVPVLIVVVIGVVTASYLAGTHKASAPTKADQPTAQKSTATTPTKTTPATKPDINTFDAAGLFNASYYRKLTDFTPWDQSPLTKEYRDFNDDGINDVFVWGELPSTSHFTFAAVWTVGPDNKPLELWYLPNDLTLAHSSWSINSSNGLENKSLNSDGSTAKINTFHWQVSTTGQGFVLEPDM